MFFLIFALAFLALAMLCERKIGIITHKKKKWAVTDGELVRAKDGFRVRYKVNNKTYEKCLEKCRIETETMKVNYNVGNPTKVILEDKKYLRKKSLRLIIVSVVCLTIGIVQLNLVMRIYAGIFSSGTT